MLADNIPDVADHIVQEVIVGQAGAGLDLQSDLAAFTLDLLHKVTGFANGGYQIGNDLAGGLADQIGAAVDDCQGIVVAGGHAGNTAIFVIFHSDLRIDTEDQGAALCQGQAFVCGSDALAAGGEAQGQCQHTADGSNQFFHNFILLDF